MIFILLWYLQYLCDVIILYFVFYIDLKPCWLLILQFMIMFKIWVLLLQIELDPSWIHIYILKLPVAYIIIMVIHSACFWLRIDHFITFYNNFLAFLNETTFIFICNSKIILVAFPFYIVILNHRLFFSKWVPRFFTKSLILSVNTARWVLQNLFYYGSFMKRLGNAFSFFKVNLVAFR